MLRNLQRILQSAIDKVGDQIYTFAPPILAALVVLLVSFLTALVVRWALSRSSRGAAIDRFLRESGIWSVLGLGRGIKASRLVVHVLYWSIIVVGCLIALNVFGTQFTDRIVATSASLLPRIVAAFAIAVAGIWLAQYFSRTALVWTHGEGLPSPRRWAVGLRVFILFLTIVIITDVLNFAENVVLAVFLIVVAGVVLALSLAVGLGSRHAVDGYLERRRERLSEQDDRSVWQHL